MKTGLLPSNRTYSEESALLRKVIEWLEPQQRNGIKVLRICDRYHKGYSDLFISVQGWFVCAELKDDEGQPTIHQIRFIEEMQKTGAVAGVCRTVAEVAQLVEEGLRRAGQCEI
jgi:hypothetical protein